MTSHPIVKLSELFGSRLMSRDEGARAREIVEELHAMGQPVRVDFSGVELMTPGFADEFFGRLSDDAFTIVSLAPALNALLHLVSSRAASRRAATAA